MRDDFVRRAVQRGHAHGDRRRRSVRQRGRERGERTRRERVEPPGGADQRTAAAIVRAIERPRVAGEELRERGGRAELGQPGVGLRATRPR